MRHQRQFRTYPTADVLRNLMVDVRTYEFVCTLRAFSSTRGMKTFFIRLKRIKELRILTRCIIKYEANILIDLSKYAIDHSVSSGHFHFNGYYIAHNGRIWLSRGWIWCARGWYILCNQWLHNDAHNASKVPKLSRVLFCKVFKNCTTLLLGNSTNTPHRICIRTNILAHNSKLLFVKSILASSGTNCRLDSRIWVLLLLTLFNFYPPSQKPKI